MVARLPAFNSQHFIMSQITTFSLRGTRLSLCYGHLGRSQSRTLNDGEDWKEFPVGIALLSLSSGNWQPGHRPIVR